MAPTNDPANDRYNPPGNLSEDFEKFTFGELEMDELFWPFVCSAGAALEQDDIQLQHVGHRAARAYSHIGDQRYPCRSEGCP